MVELKPCPCGKTPTKLHLTASSSKWAYAHGDCCGCWEVEFRTSYIPLDTKECMALAICTWNDNPRG